MSHHFRKILIGGVMTATCLLGLTAPSAYASGPSHSEHGSGSYVCTGGTAEHPTIIPSGTYRSLTVKGLCSVPAGEKVNVQGNVYVRRGAVFDSVTQSTVHIGGNVSVVQGGLLALGCMPDTDCTTQADQTVGGNITASHSLAVYLHGAAIGGNVMINGGGPGTHCGLTTEDPYVAFLTGGDNLPIKDNTIGGSVHVNGWQGCWMGLIRNQVGGSVVVQRNVATMAPTNHQGPDSTEIVANVIGGSLSCWRNVPAAQFGDAVSEPGLPAGYGPNQVGGVKRGECANL